MSLGDQGRPFYYIVHLENKVELKQLNSTVTEVQFGNCLHLCLADVYIGLGPIISSLRYLKLDMGLMILSLYYCFCSFASTYKPSFSFCCTKEAGYILN